MTLAEQYADGLLDFAADEVLRLAAEDVVATAARNADGLKAVLDLGTVFDSDSRTTRTATDDEKARARELLKTATYAYRYEQLADGSVLELRVNRAGTGLRLVAHPGDSPVEVPPVVTPPAAPADTPLTP